MNISNIEYFYKNYSLLELIFLQLVHFILHQILDSLNLNFNYKISNSENYCVRDAGENFLDLVVLR